MKSFKLFIKEMAVIGRVGEVYNTDDEIIKQYLYNDNFIYIPDDLIANNIKTDNLTYYHAYTNIKHVIQLFKMEDTNNEISCYPYEQKFGELDNGGNRPTHDADFEGLVYFQPKKVTGIFSEDANSIAGHDYGKGSKRYFSLSDFLYRESPENEQVLNNIFHSCINKIFKLNMKESNQKINWYSNPKQTKAFKTNHEVIEINTYFKTRLETKLKSMSANDVAKKWDMAIELFWQQIPPKTKQLIINKTMNVKNNDDMEAFASVKQIKKIIMIRNNIKNYKLGQLEDQLKQLKPEQLDKIFVTESFLPTPKQKLSKMSIIPIKDIVRI
jgi:hypothetical protein